METKTAPIGNFVQIPDEMHQTKGTASVMEDLSVLVIRPQYKDGPVEN